MIQVTDSKQIKLPDRKEITLCEAITALVYGNARNVVDHMVDGEVETEERRARAKDLIKRLHSAAYAGRIKFRGLKNGDDHVNGHKNIDHLYFSEPRGFRWNCDEIWDHPKFKSRSPSFTRDWRDVHLDRNDFEELLRGIGVSIQPSRDADPLVDLETSRTGLPGRPTSKQLVERMAKRKLDDGYRPESLAAFSKELAEELANTYPNAPRATPKTVENAIRTLWRSYQTPPIIIDRS